MVSQPRLSERTERYLAIPCSGNSSSRKETNHVYRILDYEHPSGRVTFRGWLTKELTEQRFGKNSVYFSNSHGLCPNCNRSLDEIL